MVLLMSMLAAKPAGPADHVHRCIFSGFSLEKVTATGGMFTTLGPLGIPKHAGWH